MAQCPVEKLLRRARKGCRVIFVPGNHDEFARAFVGNQLTSTAPCTAMMATGLKAG